MSEHTTSEHTTSEHAMLVARFADALAGADAEALDALLAGDVQYARLGRRLAGRAEVRAELLATEALRRQQWQPALAVHEGAEASLDATLRLTGRARDPASDPGYVLTLGLRAGLVASVAQQRTPPAAPRPRPIVLDEAMQARIGSALESRRPMLMAYTAVDGQPVLSFRGSVQVDAPDRLAMWIRNADGHFVRSIAANPRVALMYRDEDSKATYQFQGRARVSDDPADRERVYRRAPQAERDHDFARLGVAVMVELDRVEGYAGLGPAGQIDRVLMLRGETGT